MKQKSDSAKAANREDRLKAALKANLARRKAQARARAGSANETQADERAGKKKD
ncbi:hypothetical protein EDD52_10579 [Primorskyibacter sedentarius]|uniref:Uncharacterized protein n=1 Tax=Primorskyibacter sedentarius TaxID=745311 RepID=A0A4R3JEM4_9RHOB|nr:hypothetical protein [Primorskyibacter sedentarius]TCS64518.1 hypothetical protein EDD52_10579 [Primorskyibacter sedentarius]